MEKKKNSDYNLHGGNIKKEDFFITKGGISKFLGGERKGVGGHGHPQSPSSSGPAGLTACNRMSSFCALEPDELNALI